MIKNESATDRLIRAILGALVLIAAILWLSGWLQILAYIIAVVLLITAAIGRCGLYSILGINTKH